MKRPILYQNIVMSTEYALDAFIIMLYLELGLGLEI